MSIPKRNLILVHGLWDNPKIFRTIIKKIDRDDWELHAPHFPHNLGRKSIRALAQDLDRKIITDYGNDSPIYLLGFSMGGIICRYWLQHFSGAISRTKRFISIGSPHRGTLTAQFIPLCLLKGVAEMKRGSLLLEQLNKDCSPLEGVECFSFYCFWDLMVLPGWEAILPLGKSYKLPVLTHKALIFNQRAIDIIISESLNS